MANFTVARTYCSNGRSQHIVRRPPLPTGAKTYHLAPGNPELIGDLFKSEFLLVPLGKLKPRIERIPAERSGSAPIFEGSMLLKVSGSALKGKEIYPKQNGEAQAGWQFDALTFSLELARRNPKEEAKGPRPFSGIEALNLARSLYSYLLANIMFKNQAGVSCQFRVEGKEVIGTVTFSNGSTSGEKAKQLGEQLTEKYGEGQRYYLLGGQDKISLNQGRAPRYFKLIYREPA